MNRSPKTLAIRYDWALFIFIALITIYRGLTLYGLKLDLYVDEAQYWTWAQHLTWGYYSKPPVIALIIAATTAVLGNSEFAIKIGALLLYPVSTWLIWLIGRRLFNSRIGFWSALAFLLVPGVSLSSMIISTDVPFFVCWAGAMYAYIRAIEDDRWRWWLLAGIAGGAGLQTKYTMIIFPVSVLLHLAVTPELRSHLRSPKLWSTMLLAAIIFVPNLIWNAQHGWPTLHHTESISNLGSNAGFHWNHLGDFVAGQLAVMGPVLFIAWVILTLWRPSTWWADSRYRLLACFGLPFLIIISGQAFFGRANANWAAMAYVAGTIFVVARLIQTDHRRWLWLGIAFNASLMPIAYSFDSWTKDFGITLNRHNDPYKRVRGWKRFGETVSAIAARHPHALLLADDRTLIAEMRFYMHPRPKQVIQWNPADVTINTYTITTTMDGKQGKDFVYIAQPGPIGGAMRNSFRSIVDLGPVTIPIHPDYALHYHAWLLKDFLGYGAHGLKSQEKGGRNVPGSQP